MKDNRDAIDFGSMKITKLFRKLFWPTLLGMLSSVVLMIADGMFVGHGVGSDALAAINITSPLFSIAMGIALMFGSGVSIVAAVHLSKGNIKAANINITQSITIGLLAIGIVVALVNAFPHATCMLFGGSERLFPLVREYLRWISPYFLANVIMITGLFVVRLDGSPNFGMIANLTCCVLNIALDFLFVMLLHMGIMGAAFASSLAAIIGAGMTLWYLFFRSKKLKLYKPKFSKTALRLTWRNCCYMLKLGVPTLVAETAMSCMMVVGNYQFMSHLQEDGVAAFSVACYLIPLIFMFGNAIAQSAMPIISYNFGQGHHHRIKETLRLSIIFSIVCGGMLNAIGYFGAPLIAQLFVETTSPVYELCTSGLPLFLQCCFFLTLNLVLVGYEQSLENYKAATWMMVIRGYILIVPCFILVPMLMGNIGLWLAVPISEALTLLVFSLQILSKKE